MALGKGGDLIMPLNWSIQDCEDFESLWQKDEDGFRLNHKTETIIHLSMVIGLSKITKQNWFDFYTRMHIYEMCFGPFIYKSAGKPDYFSTQDIHRHIGLTTNVGNLSYPQFMKKVYDRVQRDAERNLEVATA